MTMAMPVKTEMLKKASNIMFHKEWLNPELSSEYVELQKRHMVAEMQSLKQDQHFQVKSRFIQHLFSGTTYDIPLDVRIQRLREYNSTDLYNFHNDWIGPTSYITMVTPTTEIAAT